MLHILWLTEVPLRCEWCALETRQVEDLRLALQDAAAQDVERLRAAAEQRLSTARAEKQVQNMPARSCADQRTRLSPTPLACTLETLARVELRTCPADHCSAPYRFYLVQEAEIFKAAMHLMLL